MATAVQDSNLKHRVFVYSTLKTGERNHYLLSGFHGVSARAEGIVLHAGPCYPYAVRGMGTAIGELYSVDSHTLARLDALEDHPRYYVRELTKVLLDNGKAVRAWIYLNKAGRRYPPIASGVWRCQRL